MIEIIATSIEDALTIEKCKANRIELVSGLSEGGLTPSYGLIEAVVKKVNIPTNVMIRPHGNNFYYEEKDIKIMLKDIEVVKKIGANGVVLGILDPNKKIPKEKLNILLKACSGMEVTFHKAIDHSYDPIATLKELCEYNEITRVLTSGGMSSAVNNIDILKKMVEITKESGKIILVGGGVTKENYRKILDLTNAKEVHFGKDVRKDKSPINEIEERLLKELVSGGE